MNLKPWIEVVKLHPDVESETTAISTYAIDLGALIEKDINIPATYKDAYSFFKATYLTSDMLNLIREVFERLDGKEGNRVLQLRSPFGGGKSHTLATLFYAINNRSEMEKNIPESKSFPKLENIKFAFFDGEKFDAISGKEVKGLKIRTIWGWLAYQLGQYEIIKEQDQKRVSPGGEIIKKVLGDKPTIILLDEVSRYLERTMGEEIGESTLYRQALEFMQTLTTEISGSRNSCLVYSLQASAREFYGDVEILSTLDHLTSRVDAKREPIRGDELFLVLRKRLFSILPSDDFIFNIVDSYIDILKRNILTYIPSESERRDFEERILKLRDRFILAYPFHPGFIDLMRERWASIPDFQRTRGVLRFLAIVLRILKKNNSHDFLVGSTDIPVDNPEVRNAFFTEVGQREPYQAVLEADFIGANSTTKRINKSFEGIDDAATQIATSILMYSFGGQPLLEGANGKYFPPGINENDLMISSIKPNLDSTLIRAVLKELVAKCLYIHYDGARYAFKTTPNVNKLLEDEADSVQQGEIKKSIKEILESELSGKPAIIWPSQNKNIPDKIPFFQIVYMPFEIIMEKNVEKLILEFFTQYGDRPRIYKNGIGISIPDKNQIEPLIRAVRYLIAIGRVREKKKSLNLTDEQLEQLRERERTEKASKDSSLRILYNSIWLLTIEDGKNILDKVEIGGRALQNSNIHERLLEIMRMSPPRLFDTFTARRLLDLMKIEQGIATDIILDTFYSSPKFPKLVDEKVLKKAIVRGVKEKLFGITNKEKVQIIKDKINFSKNNILFGIDISEDEVELSSCFIINAKLLEFEAVIESGDKQISETEEEQKEDKEEISKKIKQVSYSLNLTRKQLYSCFNALGNLAEKSEDFSLKVNAKLSEGVEPNWLRNAVEEPLEESGAIVTKESTE